MNAILLLLLAVALLAAGCAHHPSIPFTDTGHGVYLCSNYWCQRFETDACNAVGALTWIAWHGDKDPRLVASNALAEHWSLMLEMNRQQLKQAR